MARRTPKIVQHVWDWFTKSEVKLPAQPKPVSLTSPFHVIRHFDDDGNEYWSAREMMPYLGYTNWKNLESVIRKAKSACRNTGLLVEDHFSDVGKMIEIGKGGQREIADFHLTRHACNLVAMNGDPDKDEIALAQAYFSRMTMEAEQQAEEMATNPTAERARRKYKYSQNWGKVRAKSVIANKRKSAIVTAAGGKRHDHQVTFNKLYEPYGGDAPALRKKHGFKDAVPNHMAVIPLSLLVVSTEMTNKLFVDRQLPLEDFPELAGQISEFYAKSTLEQAGKDYAFEATEDRKGNVVIDLIQKKLA